MKKVRMDEKSLSKMNQHSTCTRIKYLNPNPIARAAASWFVSTTWIL